jgi:hypothetical protein
MFSRTLTLRVNSRSSRTPEFAVHVIGYGADAVAVLYMACCGEMRMVHVRPGGNSLTLRCMNCLTVTEIDVRELISPHGIPVDEVDADELARLATDSVI